MTEPNATPAPLTMTPADEAADRELLRYCSLHRMPVDTSMVDRAWAECDATRAKLAEAEAQRDEANNVRDQYEARMVAAERGYDAAESRVAALTEACTLGNRRLGYWCDLHGSLPEDRAALSAMQAALSPSQDAKEGA